jgi:transcriptional regulator with XRE-family HTH domain
MPENRLQIWMRKNALRDDDVARKIKVSRVQISRIRRGINGASVETAMKLQELTRIKWHNFIRYAVQRPPYKTKARAKA